MILGVALCLGPAAAGESLAGVSSILIETTPEAPGGPDFYFSSGDRSSLLVDCFNPTVEHVDLHFFDFRTHWSLDFAAPEGEPLAPGSYENADSVGLRDPARPFLSLGTPVGLSSCGQISGRFEVTQVSFDAQGALASFRATFEQRCGAEPWYRGEVRFNADVPVALVAPATFAPFAGRHVSYGVEGKDALGNPVTLSATGLSGSGLPQGSTFEDAGDGTGRFEWTPDNSQIGVVHWVALHGRSAAGETDTVSTRIEVIPDFDDFDHAIPIPSLAFQAALDRPDASVATDDPMCGQPAMATVWFSYTPVADGRIVASVGPPFNGGAGVGVSISSGERGALEQVGCGFHSARADVGAGRTYHIMLGFFATPTSQVRFRVQELAPRPANDEFADATIVQALPFEDSVEMAGSDPDAGDPRGCGVVASAPSTSVWYAFTPAQDTQVAVDTGEPYPYPWTVAAFTGPRGALARVACAERRLSFTARAGVPYHVMIGSTFGFIGPGFGGNDPASLPLHVSFTGRPPLRIGVVLARQGEIDPWTGSIVISGTARCSRPAEIVVSGRLRPISRRGRDTAQEFEATFQCDGVTPWSAVVESPREPSRRGTFKGGPAEVTFHATGVPPDDPDEHAVDDGRSMIMIRSGGA